MTIFRRDTYATIFARMRERARQTRVVDSSGTSSTPLDRLNIWAERDFSVSLLGAWAAVADVLMFYQERIACEGYLRTATQPRSLHELRRTQGQLPRPATSASTWLTLTVIDLPRVPSTGKVPVIDVARAPSTVKVPARAKVLSTPQPGKLPTVFETTRQPREMPIVFETAREFVAKREWNSIGVYAPNRIEPDRLKRGDTAIRVSGAPVRVRPGQPLVIAESHPSTAAAAHMITAVEPDPSSGFTRIGWAKPLQTEFDAPVLVALTRACGLFGANAPEWRTLHDSVKARYATRRGSVVVRRPGSSAWAPANSGLPPADVRVLRPAGSMLFAGTSKGIFRSLDGITWAPAMTGVTRKDVYALHVDARGYVFAGTTGGGIFRSCDHGETWDWLRGRTAGLDNRASRPPDSVIRAVATPGRGDPSMLLVATDGGVSRSMDGGATWAWCNEGLPGRTKESEEGSADVTGLALLALDDRIHLGTDRGLFYSVNGGVSWNASDAAHHVAVHDIAVIQTSSTPQLVIATDGGVFRKGDRGWAPVKGTEPATSTAGTAPPRLTVAPNAVYASTGMGVFHITEQEVDVVSTTRVATAIAATADHVVYLALPPDGFVEQEWPGFALSGTLITLDRQYQLAQPSGWLVLQQAEKTHALRYTEWSTIYEDAFMQRGTVTQLLLAAPIPEGFDRRLTVAWIQPERALTVYTLKMSRTIRGKEIALAGAHDLAVGAHVCVTGRAPDDTPSTSPRRSTQPGSAPVHTQPDIGQQTEIARIARCTVAADGTSTTIVFNRALEHEYDAATVAVCANVVRVRQGETVRNETIGSGDASKANQRFALARWPLAVRPRASTPTIDVRIVSPTPFGPGGAHDSTGVKWTCVPTLAHSGPQDRHYTLTSNTDGQSFVSFGDGVHGARLPTGHGNVRATYRVGAGPGGNVAANRLLLFRQRPPGIQRISNPLAATGGTAARTAPEPAAGPVESLLDSDGVVSVGDYASLAARCTGIGQAHATFLAAPGPTVHVTVTAAHGQVIPKDAQRLADVRAALMAAGPCRKVWVASYDPVPVHLHMRIRCPEASNVEALRRRVDHELQARFGPTVWPLARTLGLADVVHAVQGLREDLCIEVVRFHVAGDTPSIEREIAARAARWDSVTGQAHPAQLVLLEPAPVIEIKAE